MPRKKDDTSTGNSGIQVIETATMSTISEQLRVMTSKIDANQREIALARNYATDAKTQAAAIKHHLEEVLENLISQKNSLEIVIISVSFVCSAFGFTSAMCFVWAVFTALAANPKVKPRR